MRDKENVITDYWNILNNISELIRFSDQKAGIIITVYGVVLTLIYTNSTNVLLAIQHSNLQIVLAILATTSATISVIISFLCLNPRLNNPNAHSIIYFRHISNHSSHKDYLLHSSNIINDETKIISHITEQIHVNAKIADNKFTKVTWAIRFFFTTLIIVIISISNYLLHGK